MTRLNLVSFVLLLASVGSAQDLPHDELVSFSPFDEAFASTVSVAIKD